MTTITRKIPSLLNGISQQPASLRRASQGELQVNCESSLVDGLRKRPPSVTTPDVGVFSASTSAFTHAFKNDIGEDLVLISDVTSTRIWNLTLGSLVSLTFFDNTNLYMTEPSDPANTFVATDVDGDVYIANKKKVMGMKATVSGGTLKGTKQTFADLPTTGMVNGDVWKINGDDRPTLGAYYMKWNSTSLVWEESMPPGVETQIDEQTMPCRLIQATATTWQMRAIPYDDRVVGDDTVAPQPNFIDRAPRDIGFFRNRFVIAAGNYVVLSQSGPNYHNFFRQSVRDLLDNDRIDIRSNSNSDAINTISEFNKQLILFTDDRQMALGTGDNSVLTPTTGSIDQVSSYSSNSLALPVTAASALYFAAETGLFSAIREYSTNGDNTIVNVAEDTTAHCPNFLPANIIKIAVATNYDMIFCLSSTYRRRIYVYKFYWEGEQKLQSSWSYWELPEGEEIINMDVVNGNLYIYKRTTAGSPTGNYPTKIRLDGDDSQDAIGFTVHLDNRQLLDLNPVYNAGLDQTTISGWTQIFEGDFEIVAGPDHVSPGALLFTGTYVGAGSSAILPGDQTTALANDAYIGQPYAMTYRFSELFAREGGTDEDASPVLDGNLQLRSMTLRLESTGYLKAQVVPRAGASTSQYVFTGKILGTQSLIVGAPTIVDASWRFPIGANSKRVTIDLTNDTHMPCAVVSTEWAGSFNKAAGSR